MPEQSEQPGFSGVRRWKRHKISLGIHVKMRNGLQIDPLLGNGREISEGGMVVYVPFDFEIGDVICLELELPLQSEPLELFAVVKNCTGFAYGIEFVEVSDESKAILLRNCASVGAQSAQSEPSARP